MTHLVPPLPESHLDQKPRVVGWTVGARERRFGPGELGRQRVAVGRQIGEATAGHRRQFEQRIEIAHGCRPHPPAHGRNPLIAPLAVASRAMTSAESRARSARLSARSEEHTSELQSLMRISYAVFCLKKKNNAS